ncbi:MAG: hypothetical protein EBS05_21240 [Proteobacteria bacterium]|nr:hypothetical protein [Pseudomonadota bacterium]
MKRRWLWSVQPQIQWAAIEHVEAREPKDAHEIQNVTDPVNWQPINEPRTTKDSEEQTTSDAPKGHKAAQALSLSYRLFRSRLLFIAHDCSAA